MQSVRGGNNETASHMQLDNDARKKNDQRGKLQRTNEFYSTILGQRN